MTRPNRLENDVMESLWQHGEGSVREVLGRLDRGYAYTTILTVLDRLHAKGRVTREKVGGAWRYRAAHSHDELVGMAMASMLDQVRGDPKAVLMAFMERAESVSPETIDALEALIQARLESDS